MLKEKYSKLQKLLGYPCFLLHTDLLFGKYVQGLIMVLAYSFLTGNGLAFTLHVRADF